MTEWRESITSSPPEEINEILGTKQGKAFCRNYGITGPGNFEGKAFQISLATKRMKAFVRSGPELRKRTAGEQKPQRSG